MNLKHVIETIEILNVDKSESTISILELVSNTIIHNKAFIKSDGDQELLILVMFKEIIDLKSIKIHALPPDTDNEEISAPKQIHIYKVEHLKLDFDDIKSIKSGKSGKSFKCSPKKLVKGQNINLQKNAKNALKFKKIKYIAIYIESNQNKTDNTFINSIIFRGDVNSDLYKQSFESHIKNNKIKPIQRMQSGTNYGWFKWSFGEESSSDVVQFKKAKKGEVPFISDYHDIAGCIVFLELTPNGWGNINGKTMVWLRLHSLPFNKTSIPIRYQYKCIVDDKFSFIGERDAVLTKTPQQNTNGGISIGVYSMTSNNVMYRSGFEDLDNFCFECYVTIDPNVIHQNDGVDELKVNINELDPIYNYQHTQTLYAELICDDNVKECEYVKELAKIMKIYDKSGDKADDNLLRGNHNELFYHLLDHHNKEETDDFEHIMQAMGDKCDIQNCIAFKKLYGNRGSNVIINVLDVIHCFYMHSFDIGYRLSTKERECIFNEQENDEKCENDMDLMRNNNRFKRMQRIVSAKNKEVLSINYKGYDKFNEFYSYGQHFCYDLKSPDSNVLPRYQSLKEELTCNSISRIDVEQFNNEYKKARDAFNSYYRKEFYFKLPETYILSLMIYCNFTELQRKFSETCWKTIENHKYFYHLGQNVSNAVNNHGKEVGDDVSQRLYHGICNTLLLPKLIGPYLGVQIYSPLSTSGSIEVAANFSTNSGIIIEFGCPNIRLQKYDKQQFNTLATRYFAVDWISDHAAENERLFVQMKSGIYINNIYHIKTGTEYKILLQHLKIIDSVIMPEPKDWHSWKLDEIQDTINITKDIIKHQILSQNESPLKDFPVYGKKTMDAYFNNITLIDINYGDKECMFLKEIIGDKINLIQIIFKNVQRITIRNVNNDLINNMMNNIWNIWNNLNPTSKLKTITIYPSSENVSINEEKAISSDQQTNSIKDEQNKPSPNIVINNINLDNLLSRYRVKFGEIGYCLKKYDDGKGVIVISPIAQLPQPQRTAVSNLILGKHSSLIISIQ